MGPIGSKLSKIGKTTFSMGPIGSKLSKIGKNTFSMRPLGSKLSRKGKNTFSMRPIGSKTKRLKKKILLGIYDNFIFILGIEITDSAYVAVSMRIMTRVGAKVLQVLGEEGQFIKGVHSVGAPLAPGQQVDKLEILRN